MADITLDDLQAGRGYEHWATQSQMASLIDQTKEIPRIAGFFQQLSQASSKETNLQNAILTAARNNLKENRQARAADAKEYKENDRARKTGNDKINQNVSKLTQITSSFLRTDPNGKGVFGLMAKGIDLLGQGAQGLGNAAGGAADNVGKMGKGAGIASGALSVFSGALGFAAGSMRVYGQAMQDFVKLNQRLTDRGFTVSDDLLLINSAASELGISFNELERVVERGRRNFAALGGGVANGTKAFLELFHVTQSNLNQFGTFGMSQGEAASAFQEFLDQQVVTGKNLAQIRDESGKLSNEFTNLIKETSAVSKLTGVRREELLRRRFEATADTRFQTMMQGMRLRGDTERADAIMGAVGDFSGQYLGTIGNTQLGKQITAAVQGILPTAIARGSAGGMFAATGNASAIAPLAAMNPDLIPLLERATEAAARGDSDAARAGFMEFGRLVQAAPGSDRFMSMMATPGAITTLTEPLAELVVVTSRNKQLVEGAFKSTIEAFEKLADGTVNTVAVGLNQLDLSLGKLETRFQGAFLNNLLNMNLPFSGRGRGQDESTANFLSAMANEFESQGMQNLVDTAGGVVGTAVGSGSALGLGLVKTAASIVNGVTGGQAGVPGATLKTLSQQLDSIEKKLVGS